MALDNAMQVLTGDGSGMLARVAQLLQEQPAETSHCDGKVLPDYPELFKACIGSRSFELVAQAVIAVVAHNPNLAGQAIEAAIDCIPISRVTPDRVSGEYVLGLALGIFKAGSWLDNSWRNIEAVRAFEGALPGLVSRMVVCWPNAALFGRVDLNDAFRGRLSEEISSYVRSVRNEGGRRVTINLVLQKVLSVAPDRAHFSELGVLITDQICYAEFGRASVSGRVLALVEMMKALAPTPPLA